MHALDRINERYGNKFTKSDIFTITTLIKKGLCLEIVKDFVNRGKMTVLLRYNNTPMKLVYSKDDNKIITVLPLDVDEYNKYYDIVPDINTKISDNGNYEANVNKVQHNFENGFGNKEFHKEFKLEEQIRNETKFYVRNYPKRLVVLWFKKEDGSICYQVYSRKALQKRLWHFVIDGFQRQDTQLFKNTVLLYAKIYK